MFLKSVPPAVAIHSDWRSVGSVSGVGGGGGTPQSLGLPLCFNDSDSSLSSSGTPIHHKVQMIIETLRTTQSSVDMSDGGHTEGTGSAAAAAASHSSRESLRQPQGRKMKTGPSGSRGAAVSPAAMDCSSRQPPPPHHPRTIPESQDSDSDSDSSVDRGIEEAIQEYLKEKVDHKRKAEPSPVSTSPAVKLPRRGDAGVTAADARPQSCSDGNKVLTASNHIPLKNSKGSVTPVANQKKKLKKKRPSKENPVKKPAVTMLSFFKKLPSLDQRGASSTLPHPDKAQPSLAIKTEEPLDASSSSSSDDGIEEEIQRYQQQKNREQLQLSRPPQALKKEEESDSSSDDGIEEAIRRFQQEKKQKERIRQKKRKGTVKQSQLKHTTPGGKVVGVSSTDRTELTPGTKKALKPTNTGPAKRKKKEKSKTEGKTSASVPGFSPDRPAVALGGPSSDNFNGRGHFISPSRAEPTPVPILKVNTTAELMCAEAILDISKAVMPMTFDPNPQLLDTTLLVHSAVPPLPSSSSKDLSDGESSVDSEDGIELEIRKFLEQKAQMQKETPDASAASVRDSPKTFTPKPPTDSEKGDDHSEDKSSSLDSDEDLDAAIKDLLKTKKRVKKKTKKAPAKPTAVVTSSATTTTATAQPTKKHKPPSDSSAKTATKSSLSKGGVKKKSSQVKNKKPHKPVKSSHDAKPEKKGSKAPTPQAKAASLDTAKGSNSSSAAGPSVQTESLTSKVKEEEEEEEELVMEVEEEDSSSVDSDDSIEQEIRKFLAEKAKVGGGGGGGNTSTTPISTSASASTSASTSAPNSTPPAVVKTEDAESDRRHRDQNHSKATSPPRAVKMEDQQAEIPIGLAATCLDAQQVIRQKPETNRDSDRAPVGRHPAWHRPAHGVPTICKTERKWSFEESSVSSLPRGDSHLHLDCGTPSSSSSSRTHTNTHTHTPPHTPGPRTHGGFSSSSSRHSPSRTQTPSSPNEIPPTQTTTPSPTPSPARPSIFTQASHLGLGRQSPRPSVVDSCGRNTVCSSSFPAVSFYRSSAAETPASRDSQQQQQQQPPLPPPPPPRIGGTDIRSQAGGKRVGRWDQPPTSQLPSSQSQQTGGGTLLRNQGSSPGQSMSVSAPQVSRHSAGSRQQEREGKKEGREREGETSEAREVNRVDQAELVDETDLDSDDEEEDEEEEERRRGDRQWKGRQQRFPSV